MAMADLMEPGILDAPDGEAMPEMYPDDTETNPVNVDFLFQAIEADNICDMLSDEVLADIGDRTVREYEIDKASRSEWDERMKLANALAKQSVEKKNTPWPGASNIKHPLLNTACIQFAARAYPAIVQGRDVVKGQIVGKDSGVPAVDPNTGQPVVDPQTGEPAWQVPPGAKRSRADRIAEHMSYQLTEEMTEWEEDTDRLLHVLPHVGTCFRKVWFDSVLERNCSRMVPAERLFVHQNAKSLDTAPRITEMFDLYPHEITERIRAGVWRDVELGPADGDSGDEDAPHCFLEQHRYLDLDDDGYPEPYIVTVHEQTRQVVRIRARFDQDGVLLNDKGEVRRIQPVHYYVKYEFIPSTDGTFYAVGFGALLAHTNEAINTTINQLLDAGRLANTSGGIVNSSLSIKTGIMRFTPGEWKIMQLNTAGGGNPLIPIPAKEPSATLFNLLGLLIESGKEVANIKDILSGEASSANMPATTTLAIIEQGMQVYTAIYKRIYRALKAELKMLYALNARYLQPESYFNVMDTPKAISQQDYASGDADVVPVADPSVVTSMQRLAQAQFLGQYRDDPTMDQKELRRRELEAARIPDIDDLVLEQPGPTPEAVMAQAQAKALEMEAQDKRVAAMGEAEKTAAEVEKVRAEVLNTRADTLLKIAQAEAAEEGQQLEYYKLHFAALKAELDANVKLDTAEAKANAAQAEQGGMGGVAGASGDAGVSALPGGPPAGAAPMGLAGAGGGAVPGGGAGPLAGTDPATLGIG